MPETGWFDDLQNNPDNYLIVSDGLAVDQNLNPGYSSAFMPEWTNDVIRPGQARRGEWRTAQALGGPDATGGALCAVTHADSGDIGVETWDETCDDVGTGPADAQSFSSTTGFELINDNSGPTFFGTEATMGGPSYGLWFNPVRYSLQPWGTLFGDTLTDAFDPTLHGVPENAIDPTVVFESSIGLIEVQLADGDPIPEGTNTEHVNQWQVNHPLGPTWALGFTGPWEKGPIISPAGDPPDEDHPYLGWTYDDGDNPLTLWHTLFSGDWRPAWTDNYFGSGDDPATSDAMVIAWPGEVPTSIGPGESINWSRPARIAVKFVLQASRFKFVYDLPEPTVTPPRRILGRPHPARIPGDQTYQNGRRALGGIL